MSVVLLCLLLHALREASTEIGPKQLAPIKVTLLVMSGGQLGGTTVCYCLGLPAFCRYFYRYKYHRVRRHFHLNLFQSCIVAFQKVLKF